MGISVKNEPPGVAWGIFMTDKNKRITIVLTPEMELLLDGFKQKMFYNCSRSEMIRTLVKVGLDGVEMEGKTMHHIH